MGGQALVSAILMGLSVIVAAETRISPAGVLGH